MADSSALFYQNIQFKRIYVIKIVYLKAKASLGAFSARLKTLNLKTIFEQMLKHSNSLDWRVMFAIETNFDDSNK